MKPSDRPIIFFDGVCGLCNRFVDWVIKRDKSYIFSFAPLQSEAAKKRGINLDSASPETWSVLLIQNSETYGQSTAALKIISQLGGVWRIANLFLYLPKGLRDSVYRGISRNRYKWFGRRPSCRIPSKDEKNRFLF